ncbi:hypothetical protein CRE_15110 [Caenorhabditis remanei]|uniref:RRM domain-containing protein n=1 Tax=Caenorhabditis remanei TaxID=31234 RepID=E3NN76_CAERE|nr:hypothetical protein CRE_15110 [Caenorhabditis remanei]
MHYAGSRNQLVSKIGEFIMLASESVQDESQVTPEEKTIRLMMRYRHLYAPWDISPQDAIKEEKSLDKGKRVLNQLDTKMTEFDRWRSQNVDLPEEIKEMVDHVESEIKREREKLERANKQFVLPPGTQEDYEQETKEHVAIGIARMQEVRMRSTIAIQDIINYWEEIRRGYEATQKRKLLELERRQKEESTRLRREGERKVNHFVRPSFGKGNNSIHVRPVNIHNWRSVELYLRSFGEVTASKLHGSYAFVDYSSTETAKFVRNLRQFICNGETIYVNYAINNWKEYCERARRGWQINPPIGNEGLSVSNPASAPTSWHDHQRMLTRPQ